MDGLKRLMLLVSLIFLTVYIVGFAFPNEPDGFRGLKWGDAPTEDMKFLSERNYSDDTACCYYIYDDKLSIGSANLRDIFYDFTIYSKQFFKVLASFVGEANYNILKIIFEERYGEPTYVSNDRNYNSLSWTGNIAKVHLYYNIKKGNSNEHHKGWFAIESLKIDMETPEDNRKKEVKKAKADF
jgi:hypothetical protein